MATFTYRAYDANGGNADGQIETLSLEIAKKQLQDKQLMVVDITEDGVVSDGIQFLTRRRVSAKEIEYLTGELSLLLIQASPSTEGSVLLGAILPVRLRLSWLLICMMLSVAVRAYQTPWPLKKSSIPYT